MTILKQIFLRLRSSATIKFLGRIIKIFIVIYSTLVFNNYLIMISKNSKFVYQSQMILKKLKEILKNIFCLFTRPYFAMLFPFFCYIMFGLLRNNSIFSLSSFPYFNFLADAFLHGQLHFRLDPPSLHDLIVFNDKVYAYWPPFPAILLMPFVAIFGVNFSDVLFNIIIGSINVLLFSILLVELKKKNIISLDQIKHGLLVIFFAF